jgi:localization factor PodJL
VKVDTQRAKVWYERAAAQGNVKAMHNLAVLAASADPKGDYASAARWFKAAAEFGLADSQYNLAVLHENGMGVEKNLQQSYKWLLLAAKSGDKDATGRLKALKPKLSADEVETAEAEAQEWSPKRMDGLANDARVAGQVWKGTSRRS